MTTATATKPATKAPAVVTFELTNKQAARIGILCQLCTDTDCTRFSLGGVRFELDGPTLTTIGTDGRRLCTATTKVMSKTGTDSDDTISGVYNCEALGKKLARVNVDNLSIFTVSLSAVAVSFQWETARGKTESVACPVVDGRYPNWRQVIPTWKDCPAGSIDFSVGDWADAINEHESEHGADMAVNGKVSFSRPLELSHKGHTGADLSCLINQAYILDWVKAANRCGISSDAKLSFDGPSSPVLVTTEAAQLVVMPMSRDRR